MEVLCQKIRSHIEFIKFLKDNADSLFKARDIALYLVKEYPEIYDTKNRIPNSMMNL